MWLDNRYDIYHWDDLGANLWTMCCPWKKLRYRTCVVGIPFVGRFINCFVLPPTEPIYGWVLRPSLRINKGCSVHCAHSVNWNSINANVVYRWTCVRVSYMFSSMYIIINWIVSLMGDGDRDTRRRAMFSNVSGFYWEHELLNMFYCNDRVSVFCSRSRAPLPHKCA